MKYYTAFAWDIEPYKLHVTHKFLGELTIEDERQTKAFLRHVFQFWIKIKHPVRLKFDGVQYFGAKNNIRVLVPKENWVESLSPFEIIRDELVVLRRDDFPYKPHVTSSESTALSEPFTRYVFMKGEEIILEIPLEINC